MSITVISLVLIPLLCAAFAFFKMLTARKLADNGIGKGKVRDDKCSVRFITLVCMLASGVIFGAVELVITMSEYGVKAAPEALSIHILITAVLTGVSELIKGVIGAGQIENGALTDDKMTSKAIAKMCLAEILAAAALVYYFISIATV